MAAGDWGEAVLLAADLGQYVGDCHQPLHTTKNYDGQLTGNKGIHLRYEIDMIRRNLHRLKADPARAVYVKEPLEHIFGTIRGTWSFVDSIMSADCQARKKDPVYGDDYYQVLWEKTGRFTIKQLSRASRILADLWYTAWIDAGRPAFPPAAAVVTCAGLQADPHVQDLMNVQGVVTIGSGVLDREHTRLYIQDQSERGILVFDHDPVDEDIVRGDLVQVEGIIHDYRGITEVSGPLVTVLDRGCAAPPPRALTTAEANDPEWDGTLIQVRGAVVFILRQESWTRLHLDDGSGAIVVLAWKDTELDLREVQEGDVLTVCGVGTYLADEGSYAILPGYEDQVVCGED
jgi:DNA/RNA endonuclease YhcR with UshA esterase domain